MDKKIEEIKNRLLATTQGVWKIEYAEGERFSPERPEEDPCIISENGQYIAQTTYDGLSNTCRPTMYADA